MSKTIQLTDAQFDILISQLTADTLTYGERLGQPGLFSYLISVNTAKEALDDVINALTTSEAPGVKSADLAKSIIDKKDKPEPVAEPSPEPEGGE